MDEEWFKKRTRALGKTAADIARKMGRDRTVVSHIYQGRQKMSLEWAQAFAEVLEVDLDVVLEKSGSLPTAKAKRLSPGYAESDATPFESNSEPNRQIDARIEAFGGGKPGIDAWRVSTSSLTLEGFQVGDFILVDTNRAETARAGDVVLAQKHDHSTGVASTVLRRYEPPVLVASSTDANERRVLVVDGSNVVIMGKVIASWRSTT